MAKTPKKQEGSYDQWVKQYNKKTGKETEKEFEKVQKVRNRLEEGRTARQNNCYWGGVSGEGTGTSTGGDWTLKWDAQEKCYLPWYQKSSSDSFESNVKSPMTTARVNAFVNQYKKVNLGWDARPNNDDDRNKAKIASKVMDYWFQNTGAKEITIDIAQDAAIHGSAIFKVCYVHEKRKGKFAKSDYGKMSDEEKEQVKDKKTIYEEREFTVFRDALLELVPIKEYYADPNCVNIQGPVKAATWNVRRQIMSLDAFKLRYKDMQGAMNIDLVKPFSAYTTNASEYQFFRPPQDVFNKEAVEVLEYENIADDEYLIVANDQLIIDKPLPYNHKQLSYHKVDFIKVPNQFYGMGIPDLLANNQGAQEIIMNMAYDYAYRSNHLRFFVDAENFGELSEELIRNESDIIPIDLTDNQPIGSKVQQMQIAPIGFDIFNLLDLTERHATLSTQIDPSQLSLQQRNTTATSTVLNKEQLESMIAGVIENFVNEGFTTAGRQVWKLKQQFETIPEIKKIVGEDGEEETVQKYKSIRLKDLSVNVLENNEVEFEENKGDYGFFELKPDFLNTLDDLDIVIRPDSLEVTSKAVEQQRMKEEFAQLTQFAVNPDNPAAVANHPLPLFNAKKLAQRYVDVENLPEDLLLSKEDSDEMGKKTAEEHVMRILNGENVPGEPGENEEHRKFEADTLLSINAQIADVQQMIEQDLQSKMQSTPQFDQFTGAPLDVQPEPDIMLQNTLDKLQSAADRLAAHLSIDNMPASMIEEAALGGNAPQQPQQAPEPLQAPMPQGMGMQDIMPGFGGQMM